MIGAMNASNDGATVSRASTLGARDIADIQNGGFHPYCCYYGGHNRSTSNENESMYWINITSPGNIFLEDITNTKIKMPFSNSPFLKQK
jgi:hypothetical protein